MSGDDLRVLIHNACWALGKLADAANDRAETVEDTDDAMVSYKLSATAGNYRDALDTVGREWLGIAHPVITDWQQT